MSESVSIDNSINPVDKFKLVTMLKYLHAVQAKSVHFLAMIMPRFVAARHVSLRLKVRV